MTTIGILRSGCRPALGASVLSYVQIEPLVIRVAAEPGRWRLVDEVIRVLRASEERLFCCTEPLGLGVNRYEPRDIPRIRGRVQADDHPAEREPGENVGTANPRRTQRSSRLQQRVEVEGYVSGRPGHRDTVAPADALRLPQPAGPRRSGPVVDAHPGEPSDGRHDRQQTRIMREPLPAAVPRTRFEHDRRSPTATTLEIQPASAMDAHAAREVAPRQRTRARGCARRPAREQQEGGANRPQGRCAPSRLHDPQRMTLNLERQFAKTAQRANGSIPFLTRSKRHAPAQSPT